LQVRQLELQPLPSPFLRRFRRTGFAESHGQHGALAHGAGLHHPAAGLGMHQPQVDRHGSQSLALAFLECSRNRAEWKLNRWNH
jgi:hypothetical protein